MMLDPSATHFGKVKISTLQRAINDHRRAVMPFGSPEIQETWARLEQWLDPIFTTDAQENDANG